MTNIILNTNSYKASHWKLYPPDLEATYSYLESRGGRFSQVVFFGLQYFLRKYLVGSVFGLHDVEEAASLFGEHFEYDVFNEQGWRRLYQKYQGMLPIRVKAVPEGSIVPCGNVLATMETTDPEFPWLVNYFETLLFKVWYPCTVATQSVYTMRLLLHHLQRSGDPALLPEMLHDYGARGAVSIESEAIAGAAHLLSFSRSDSLAAIKLLRDCYGAEEMSGKSIAASEHSTVISWNQSREVEAYHNMLTAFPTGTICCVSDAYNIFEACETMWGGDLKHLIETRDGVVLIRPDSGDPIRVIRRVLEILGTKFGSSQNAKGYRTLPPYIRVAQSDGVGLRMISRVLRALEEEGWSADNLRFGIGGASIRNATRDTQRFGLKCCAIKSAGKWDAVYKSPITDLSKSSKKGRLALIRTSEGAYRTVEGLGTEVVEGDLLSTVFEDGKLVRPVDLKDVRSRLNDMLCCISEFEVEDSR